MTAYMQMHSVLKKLQALTVSLRKYSDAIVHVIVIASSQAQSILGRQYVQKTLNLQGTLQVDNSGDGLYLQGWFSYQ